jgi:hypothetical protein
MYVQDVGCVSISTEASVYRPCGSPVLGGTSCKTACCLKQGDRCKLNCQADANPNRCLWQCMVDADCAETKPGQDVNSYLWLEPRHFGTFSTGPEQPPHWENVCGTKVQGGSQPDFMNPCCNNQYTYCAWACNTSATKGICMVNCMADRNCAQKDDPSRRISNYLTLGDFGIFSTGLTHDPTYNCGSVWQGGEEFMAPCSTYQLNFCTNPGVCATAECSVQCANDRNILGQYIDSVGGCGNIETRAGPGDGCGNAKHGGARCHGNCCDTQWHYCHEQAYCFGSQECKNNCMSERGC